MAKWVYLFNEGNANMRNLLGGKGANLAEMTNLGMPIPQGFTVTTEACTNYYESGKKITEEIQNQIFEAMTWLEQENGKKFVIKKRVRVRYNGGGGQVTIPDGVQEIASGAFAESKNLNKIILPTSLTTIRDARFRAVMWRLS